MGQRRLSSATSSVGLPGFADLAGLARHIELRAVSRWVGLGLAVGLLSGGAASLLYVGFEFVRHHVMHRLIGLHPLEPAGEPALFGSGGAIHEPLLWLMVLAPAVGAFLSAWVVWALCPRAAGGNEGWLEAFHTGRGKVPARLAPVKLLGGILHLGFGASVGREGPIAHIGAGLGVMVSRLLRLSERDRRLLLIAGAAGGIGAIFRTPLGGALFIVEVLYSDDFEADAIVPAVLSSVVAYSLFTAIFGETVLFEVASHYEFNIRELPLYGLMAICVGVVGVVFITLHHSLRHFVESLPVWPPLAAGVTGLLVGLLALLHPAALSAGYGWMQEALVPTGKIGVGWVAVGTMLMIASIKVVSTSLSSSSTAVGGVFGPSVVIGGMVGGAFGMAFHQWMPDVVSEPSAYMIVGMACFVGGVTSAPISTLVMANEMTGSYELLVPTMLAEVVAFTLIRRLKLYEQQVPTRRDSPAHAGEYVLDILQDLKVGQVFTVREVQLVARELPLSGLLRQSTEGSQAVFPVMGEDGAPEGLVTLETVRAFLYDEDIGMLAIAADCESPFVSVSPEDTLAVALERMARSHYQQLPVVDEDDGRTIVGLITYDDLLQAYSRELSLRRSGKVAPELPSALEAR